MSDALPEDMTELYDADVPRVDLVGKGANGIPGFLLMKTDGAAGLLDADYVRDLIAKADPEPKREDTVTMTGSPAAIAAMIHEAAVRKASASSDPVEKAKYDAEDRKRMAGNGQAMDDGSYPIADEADLDDAIRAVGRGGASHDAIRRHIISRAKSLGASSKIPDTWAPDGSLKKGMGPMEMDDLDLTEVLADPEVDAPGNATTPGSPAWEAIDAATACKWTAVLARARAAIDVMAEREMLEAAAGADGDAESAWDLQDACCAIDYAISVLAPFAVGEHAEAEMGADMLAAVGKAVADATPPLEVIEGLAPVRKAGRVLSSANEAAIRGAVESLQKVLASLPAAPTVEDAVTKTANEEPDMPTPTPSEVVTADAGQQPAMGTAEATPKPEAGVPVTEVGKADGEKTPMVVVYDQKGKLIGIVDPADVTPVANSEADPEDMPAADSDDAPAAEAAPADSDLTPAPAAEAGTPADAGDGVAKTDADMLKSIAHDQAQALLDDFKTAQEQAVAKQASDLDALVKQVAELAGVVKAIGEQAAPPKVFTNGAVPPRDLRGMNHGQAEIDVAKAREQRAALYRAPDAASQNQIANDMQAQAIAALSAIHGRPPQS